MPDFSSWCHQAMLLAKPYLQLLWGLVRSIPLSEGLTTATVAALIWHFTRALKRVENDFADKITAVQTDHAKRVADLQTEINWLYVARAELQMKINRCEYEVLRAIMDRRESFLELDARIVPLEQRANESRDAASSG